MRHLVLLTLAALMAVAGYASARPAVVNAQTAAARPAFVYGINAAVPGSFVGTFAPGDDPIYLLAGQVSVISPRMTEIYPWPITNEYRANWHALNEPVPGTLEVLRNGAVVAELAPTDYTIHFRQEEGTTSAEIFLGQAAVDADARFRARQQAFQEASRAYQEAEQAWLAAASDANLKKQQGESVALPPEPGLPDPIGVFSNGLSQGMPLDLDPGEYRIRLRAADGTIVAGSDRALTVFNPRRTAVGYTVVPESRWTTPLESPAPGDVILGEPGTNLYLEPHLAREYPARAWALLQNPQQSAGSAGDWEWVNGERLSEGTLEIVQGDRVVSRNTLTPYQVKQMPGSQLGYEVHPLGEDAGNQKPDFQAYPIRLEAAGQAVQVRLVSAQGEIMAGSERQVSAARDVPLTRLFLLPLAPLAIGTLVTSRRRRGAKAPLEITG